MWGHTLPNQSEIILSDFIFLFVCFVVVGVCRNRTGLMSFPQFETKNTFPEKIGFFWGGRDFFFRKKCGEECFYCGFHLDRKFPKLASLICLALQMFGLIQRTLYFVPFV